MFVLCKIFLIPCGCEFMCVCFFLFFVFFFFSLWHAGALHSKQEMGWQRKSWYNVLASINYWTTGNHCWSIISGRMSARYVREPVAGIGRLSVHQRFLLGCCHRSELRSCVKVKVAVLDSPSLTVLMVSVDVKQHWTRVQELCESRGGRPGLSVPNSPYGLCGHKATLNLNLSKWTCVILRVLFGTSVNVSLRGFSFWEKRRR